RKHHSGKARNAVRQRASAKTADPDTSGGSVRASPPETGGEWTVVICCSTAPKQAGRRAAALGSAADRATQPAAKLQAGSSHQASPCATKNGRGRARGNGQDDRTTAQTGGQSPSRRYGDDRR